MGASWNEDLTGKARSAGRWLLQTPNDLCKVRIVLVTAYWLIAMI